MSIGTHPAKSRSASTTTRVARVAVAILSALALVLGLAPAANAQSNNANLENFRITLVADGSSDIRPGGNIRWNVNALNTDSGWGLTTYLFNWGVHAPSGFTFNSFGGQIRDHFTRSPNWHGGAQTSNTAGVGRQGERDMWIRLNIPNNVMGGTVMRFGAGVEKNLTGRKWVDNQNIVSVTMPAVATTTQAISVSPTTGRAGESVTLSTRVSANHGTNTPTGTVRFNVDGQIRTATVNNGVATTTTSFATAGSKSVTATYLPANTNQWSGSSRSGTVNIRTEATQTDLTLDPVEVLAGGTVQASASVTPPGAAGEIEFTAGDETVRVPVGANGSATAEIPADTTGEMTVTATFIPADPQRYTSSSDSRSVDVYEQTSTSTEVTVDADPVQAGQATTLTATVSPETAAGTVEFTIDGQTYPATVTGGTATLEHTFNAAGSVVVVADFTPTNTDRYTPSSGQVTVNVEAETTQTALTLDPVEVTAGGEVTASAQITPADAAGQVRFDYGNQTRTVDVADGRAATTFEALTAGNGTITATFLPTDPERYTESSDTQPVEVNAETTQTNLTLDPVEVTAGGTITATAVVTPADAVGQVEFTVGTQTDTVDLTGGTATAEFTLDTAGEATVTATFIPADPQRYTGSSDEEQVTVDAEATRTAVTVNADPARVGEETTLTATVMPAGAAGTVTFTVDGDSTPVEVVDDVATLSHTFTDVGQFPITAEFTPANTDRYNGSTGQVTVNVEAETTQTNLTLDPVEVTAGGSITATAVVTPADAVGQVEFTVGTQTDTVDLTGGTATAEFTLDTAGEATVTATFIPTDPDRYTGSTDTQTVDVHSEAVAAPTTVELDAGTAETGEEITLTATVNPSDASGQVRFTVDGVEHLVPVVDGVATLVHVAGERGSYTVRAEFVPADPAAHAPSDATETLVVSDDEAPGTDPGDSTTGSLSLVGLIHSIGVAAVVHSSGSLAALGG